MKLIKVLLSGSIVLQALMMPAQSSLPDAPGAKPLVYESGGDVTSPKVVYAVEPEYTEEARRDRVQGTTKVSLIVDADGKPLEVKVTRSLASMVEARYSAAARALDEKAVEAVRQYRFRPGLRDGKPVAVLIRDFDVTFHLI